MEKLDSSWRRIRQSGPLLIPTAGSRTKAAADGGAPRAGLEASLGWVRLVGGCCSWSSSVAAAAAADAVAVAVAAAVAGSVSLAAGARKVEGIRWAAANSAEVHRACRSVAAVPAAFRCQILVLTSRSRIGFSLRPADKQL